MRLPEFDYQNALEAAVGAEGLSAADLNEPGARAAVESFRQRARSGEVGFPSLPKDAATARAVVEFAEDLRPKIDDVLVVGIGGSALGAYALDVAMRGPHPVQISSARKAGGKHRKARPRLVSLDNVDPGFIEIGRASCRERVYVLV